jgi:hypothetical protein
MPIPRKIDFAVLLLRACGRVAKVAVDGYTVTRSGKAMQFRLRHVFYAITVVALILGGWIWYGVALKNAHRDAVREAYTQGRITLEQARDRVGNEVDRWPHRPQDGTNHD